MKRYMAMIDNVLTGVYLAPDAEAAVEQARREGMEAGTRLGVKESTALAESETRERIVRELGGLHSRSDDAIKRKAFDYGIMCAIDRIRSRPAPEPKRLERLCKPDDPPTSFDFRELWDEVNALIDAENERRGTR